jgi:hypothetical protein
MALANPITRRLVKRMATGLLPTSCITARRTRETEFATENSPPALQPAALRHVLTRASRAGARLSHRCGVIPKHRIRLARDFRR